MSTITIDPPKIDAPFHITIPDTAQELIDSWNNGMEFHLVGKVGSDAMRRLRTWPVPSSSGLHSFTWVCDLESDVFGLLASDGHVCPFEHGPFRMKVKDLLHFQVLVVLG